MKRILAFALLLCMAFSVMSLTACSSKKNTDVDNIYADFEEFDSYVPKDSEIIGTWMMVSPTNDEEWQFFGNTTLHMTKITGDVRMTDVCTYNYDGKGNLSAYVFNDSKAYTYTVSIEGESLIVTDSEGAKATFERIK